MRISEAPSSKTQGRETAPSKKEVTELPETKETPQERYHKAHTTSICIRIMHNTESDILEKLDRVPNKAGYIKNLIRADIERNEK